MGLKRTFEELELTYSDCDGLLVCNAKHYSKDDVLDYFKEEMEYYYSDMDDFDKENLEVKEVYWRYLRKDELEDYDQIEDYKNGRSWFTQCSKNEKGAFKCWMID